MFIPANFSFRGNEFIPIIEVTGECDKNNSYLLLLNIALNIIKNAIYYEGKLMVNNPKGSPKEKNTVFFTLIFPNMKKREEFLKKMIG